MSFIKVTAEELQTVSTRLTSTASQIASENTTALNLVNGLVGQGWEGAASDQFEILFNQWKTSADSLLSSLDGISRLLSQAGTAYADTEQSIQQSMTSH